MMQARPPSAASAAEGCTCPQLSLYCEGTLSLVTRQRRRRAPGLFLDNHFFPLFFRQAGGRRAGAGRRLCEAPLLELRLCEELNDAVLATGEIDVAHLRRGSPVSRSDRHACRCASRRDGVRAAAVGLQVGRRQRANADLILD